jgi:hypothetical protein
VKEKLMKQSLVLASLFLGIAYAAPAQEPTLSSFVAGSNMSANAMANATAGSNSAFAEPIPKPAPQSAYDDRDNYRYELGMSVAFVRFRSSPINASMIGPNTSFAYYATKRLALESNVTTAFGSEIFDREHTKYLFFGVGPKIVFGNGKWRPFVHFDFGFVHMLPQTAGNSQKGFGAQLGGGAELHLNPLWSLRFGGDFVRAQVYPGGQNNVQFVMGVLYHFK